MVDAVGEDVHTQVHGPVVERRESQSGRHLGVRELGEEGKDRGRGQGLSGSFSTVAESEDLRIILDEGRADGEILEEVQSSSVAGYGFACEETDSFLSLAGLDELVHGIAAGPAYLLPVAGEKGEATQADTGIETGGAPRALLGRKRIPQEDTPEGGESGLQEVLHRGQGDKLDQDVLQLPLPDRRDGHKRSLVIVGRPASQWRLSPPLQPK